MIDSVQIRFEIPVIVSYSELMISGRRSEQANIGVATHSATYIAGIGC